MTLFGKKVQYLLKECFNFLLEKEFFIQETNDPEKKLEILYHSRGFLSGEQAGHIVSSIARPKDRMKALLILEPVEK